MSRIGKKIIEIPKDVTVTVNGHDVAVRGPKGNLSLTVLPAVEMVMGEANGQKTITVNLLDTDQGTAIWGLSRQLINNMIIGVTKGYSKQLELQGVGFKVALEGKNKLNMTLGFSHPVVFNLPEGISAKIEKNIITIEGIDKQLVGEIAAQIRRLRKPDAYKGKGVRYVGEVIKLKPGKAAKTGAGAK